MDSKGQSSHGDEDNSQSICNLLKKYLPERDALGSLDSIRAVPHQAGGGLVIAQPILDIGIQILGDTNRGERVREARDVLFVLVGRESGEGVGVAEIWGFRYRRLVVLRGEGRRVRRGGGVIGVFCTI